MNFARTVGIDMTFTMSILASGSLFAATTYTDDALLAMGKEAWDNNQCVKAAEFIFAYALRNPPALQRDPQHQADVQKMLSWCEANTVISGGSVAGKADEGPSGGARPAKPTVNLRAPNVPNNPQRRCNVYATIAVAQNQSNQANSCAFSGNRWDSRPQYHLSWCMTTPADVVRGETLARQTMLDQCAP